jgi:hypothetical protein
VVVVKRTLLVIALTAMLGTMGLSSATAADATCTRGDVQALANAAASIARKHFNGLNGHSDPWPDCQFRLYDDNDDENSPDAPEIPHVFTDQDYILAGVLAFEFFEFLDPPDYGHAAAVAFIDTFQPRLFFGSVSTPDADLAEVPLSATPHKGGALPLGNAIIIHHYAIFAPGSLTPGTYKFRTEFSDSIFGDSTAYGVITIVHG